jgi:hypothetical protein
MDSLLCFTSMYTANYLSPNTIHASCQNCQKYNNRNVDNLFWFRQVCVKKWDMRHHSELAIPNSLCWGTPVHSCHISGSRLLWYILLLYQGSSPTHRSYLRALTLSAPSSLFWHTYSGTMSKEDHKWTRLCQWGVIQAMKWYNLLY